VSQANSDKTGWRALRCRGSLRSPQPLWAMWAETRHGFVGQWNGRLLFPSRHRCARLEVLSTQSRRSRRRDEDYTHWFGFGEERIPASRCGSAGAVSRVALESGMARLGPCLIGMEAFASAHHWGRVFERQGHTVQPIAPRLSNQPEERRQRRGRHLRSGGASQHAIRDAQVGSATRPASDSPDTLRTGSAENCQSEPSQRIAGRIGADRSAADRAVTASVTLPR
jgi:hypothetical protein